MNLDMWPSRSKGEELRCWQGCRGSCWGDTAPCRDRLGMPLWKESRRQDVCAACFRFILKAS